MIRNGSDGANGGGSWITGVDGLQRLRQVDDTDAAVREGGGEVCEKLDRTFRCSFALALWPCAAVVSWNFVIAPLKPRDTTSMSFATVTNA